MTNLIFYAYVGIHLLLIENTGLCQLPNVPLDSQIYNCKQYTYLFLALTNQFILSLNSFRRREGDYELAVSRQTQQFDYIHIGNLGCKAATGKDDKFKSSCRLEQWLYL